MGFILICCDGVWDVQTNQEAVDFVRHKMPASRDNPKPMVSILESLLDRCLSTDLKATRGLGADNMTAVIVHLPPFVAPAKQADGVTLQPISAAPELLDATCRELTQSSGTLTVRVALHAACGVDQVHFDVCEKTAELEIRVAP